MALMKIGGYFRKVSSSIRVVAGEVEQEGWFALSARHAEGQRRAALDGASDRRIAIVVIGGIATGGGDADQVCAHGHARVVAGAAKMSVVGGGDRADPNFLGLGDRHGHGLGGDEVAQATIAGESGGGWSFLEHADLRVRVDGAVLE